MMDEFRYENEMSGKEIIATIVVAVLFVLCIGSMAGCGDTSGRTPKNKEVHLHQWETKVNFANGTTDTLSISGWGKGKNEPYIGISSHEDESKGSLFCKDYRSGNELPSNVVLALGVISFEHISHKRTDGDSQQEETSPKTNENESVPEENGQ